MTPCPASWVEARGSALAPRIREISRVGATRRPTKATPDSNLENLTHAPGAASRTHIALSTCSREVEDSNENVALFQKWGVSFLCFGNSLFNENLYNLFYFQSFNLSFLQPPAQLIKRIKQ